MRASTLNKTTLRLHHETISTGTKQTRNIGLPLFKEDAIRHAWLLGVNWIGVRHLHIPEFPSLTLNSFITVFRVPHTRPDAKGRRSHSM